MGGSGLVAIALLVLAYAAVSRRLSGVGDHRCDGVRGRRYLGERRGARLARQDDRERIGPLGRRGDLAGDEVILVERGTLGVPLGEELVRSTWPAATRPRSSLTLPIALLQALEHCPQVWVQLATSSVFAPATGVRLPSSVRR